MLLATICAFGLCFLPATKSPALEPRVDPIIDPDRSIFGMELGSSTGSVSNHFGKAIAAIHFERQQVALVYSDDLAFRFDHDKLVGVSVGRKVLDYRLFPSIPLYSIRRIDWRLSNGITNGMEMAEVKRILGLRLYKEPLGSRHYFLTDKSRVDLEFPSKDGRVDAASKVYSVLVSPRPRD